MAIGLFDQPRNECLLNVRIQQIGAVHCSSCWLKEIRPRRKLRTAVNGRLMAVVVFIRKDDVGVVPTLHISKVVRMAWIS